MTVAQVIVLSRPSALESEHEAKKSFTTTTPERILLPITVASSNRLL